MSELSQSIHLKNTPVGDLPDDWSFAPISNVVKDSKKVTYGIVQPGSYTDTGVLLIRGQDYIKGWASEEKFFRVALPLHRLYKRSTTVAGDVLLCIVGATTGAVNVVPEWITEANITQTTARISCESGKVDPSFVFYVLASETGQAQVRKYVKGSAQPGLNLADVERFYVPLPPLPQQRKIARILTTVDNLIEKTEALIEKYKSIKQGMMHDLFTRGVDQSGRLRPSYEDAPELYKESELGWIPKEWEADSLGNLVESAIDGPFGSNLKTAHYIYEPGVRVIRLQNVDVARYDDTHRAFIPSSHANKLSRHKVVGGDVVVAALGEKRHPVGRACLYPLLLPPAINKADCFRIRCDKQRIGNPYLMFWLNTEFVQPEIQRFRQGVTLQRINLTNLKRLLVPLPDIAEQRVVESRLHHVDELMATEDKRRDNLCFQKSGLMQDLLTGKVRVSVDETEDSNHPTESVSGGVGL